MPRLLIVSDAWHPQVNGVVRSLETVGETLEGQGYTVEYLTPSRFWTFPLPSYPEIRLSVPRPRSVQGFIERFAPDYIHIATEGTLGLAARTYCLTHGAAFTTSYHTRFPEYVAARLPVPVTWSYGYLRWFHSAATTTMVATSSVRKDLRHRLFRHLSIWPRGVELSQFNPGPRTLFSGLPRPHMVCVGRVAVEKNVEAFLDLDLPGTKIVVGDGPQREALERAYPQAVFTGKQTGADLTAIYRSADVLVFPSRTDTFGNVMLEALACGTPVAAYPVMGPIDILTDPACAAIDDDLEAAVMRALPLSRGAAAQFARGFTWEASAQAFAANLTPVAGAMARAA